MRADCAPPRLVLLVDDERLVRDVLQAALEEGGYEVVAADSGQAAMSLLDLRGGECRVLVTDVDLGPGPSGWDVARRARQIHPDLAVVYVSGGELHAYSSQSVSNSAVLEKPFGVPQIVAAVTVLTAARAPANDHPGQLAAPTD
jgi:CheY-like chemotaxis protein